MPADERAAMVRSMVERLASRLETSPHDAGGWKRLIRSRIVLGEKQAASAAMRKALEIFKDEPAEITALAALASELGVTSE
jgi:cytochrome c-type biogenesis protein CcmH